MYQAPFFAYRRPSQSVQIDFDDRNSALLSHILGVCGNVDLKKEGHELNKLLINCSGQVSRFLVGV